MWLVNKHGTGSEESRLELPEALEQTLRAWYDGTGNDADEDASIVLVQQARRNNKWLACHCRGHTDQPPLMSPAFLAIADTYYLRRLTGKRRTMHHTRCPYFRDQAPPRIREKLTPATHRMASDGFFELLRPMPEHLAQSPTYTSPDDRTRGASVPRLARLLWELIDTARRNVILPIATTKGQGRRSISAEFKAIREAAKAKQVAPKVGLSEVIFVHADAYLKGQVVARLKALERRWPAGHAPQAFLLLFTNAIRGNTLYLPGGRTITTTSRVLSPSTRAAPVHGPFLTLVVVGKHPDAHDYQAIGAYAQPIQSGLRFLPVRTDNDRKLIRSIDEARWRFHLRGIDLQLTIPIFDALVENELVRPSFVIDALDQQSGEMRTLIFDDPAIGPVIGENAQTRRYTLLSKIGNVIFTTPNMPKDIEAILETNIIAPMRESREPHETTS